MHWFTPPKTCSCSIPNVKLDNNGDALFIGHQQTPGAVAEGQVYVVRYQNGLTPPINLSVSAGDTPNDTKVVTAGK